MIILPPDPFKMAEELNIKVLYHSLGEIYGYYLKHEGTKIIVINKDLSDDIQRFTCAHELGHATLHEDEATPQLSTKSITNHSKLEHEANSFAVKLLIDGRHRDYYFDNKYKVLDFYGLPHEMERYLKGVEL